MPAGVPASSVTPSDQVLMPKSAEILLLVLLPLAWGLGIEQFFDWLRNRRHDRKRAGRNL